MKGTSFEKRTNHKGSSLERAHPAGRIQNKLHEHVFNEELRHSRQSEGGKYQEY